jgi:group I intron endonuclease
MMYFGVTKHPDKRFKEHERNKSSKSKSFLRNAIQKHGIDGFVFKVLVAGERRYCMELEAKAVREYNTITPNGYNICGGGIGPIAVMQGESHCWYGKKFSQEHKEKISNAHRGKKRPPEIGEKLRAMFTGRPISEEQKAKISKTLTGTTHSDEYKANMSRVLKGRKLSLEWIEKIRIANTGKKHTEETKAKMSQSRKFHQVSLEQRKRQGQALKERWADPLFKEMMINARKKKTENKNE